jgi:protein-disulfide isomerase
MPEEKKNSKEDKKQNKGFAMGLVSGIAVIAVIGMVVFGTLYFSNQNGDGSVAGDDDTKQEDTEDKAPEVNLSIADNDYVLGNPDAKIKIFEFSDFQCPYCARFHEVMNQIVDEYPNDVAWIFKQFPIQSHPLGMPGAMATECAGDQGKFWEMSDMIFSNQETLTIESFAIFAGDLGLDLDAFNQCMTDNPHGEKIANDYQTGITSGVRGTPSSFVNGNIIPGALPYESMKQMVDELLK